MPALYGMSRQELIGRLTSLSHGEHLAIQQEELAMSIPRAKHVIATVSGDGINSKAYIKKVINNLLYVFCVHTSQEDQAHSDYSTPAAEYSTDISGALAALDDNDEELGYDAEESPIIN